MLDDAFKKKLLPAEFNDILGQDQVKRMLKAAILAQRHLILMGPPGVGKTTIAKSVAELLDPIDMPDAPHHYDPKAEKREQTKKVSGMDRFVRVQGSPDLTAEDLLGDIDPLKAMEFGPLSMEAFTPGKIFKANKGILFFDEINRAPEKLQNALLQVLSEKKVTIGSYEIDFESDFLCIATMNPEDSSTETLSEVLLDRFDMITMSYPETQEIEEQIVAEKGISLVDVPKGILHLIVHYVRSLRADVNLERVPSVRASIGLYELSQSHAQVAGRKKVTAKDVQAVLDTVISHRIQLKPSQRMVKNITEYTREKFETEQEKFAPDANTDLEGESGSETAECP